MHTYMEQGRFGEFITEIMELHAKRKQDEERKENENRLWTAYIHSMSDKSFIEWKQEVEGKAQNNRQPQSKAMSNEQVENELAKARDILKRTPIK